MPFRRLGPALVLFSLGAGGAGCASVQSAMLTGPAPVANAPLKLDVVGHRAGSVSARLPDGATCRGRFNTIADAVDTWDEQQQTYPEPEISQLGMLVLVCPAGLVLRCDFSRSWEGAGSGLCHDGQRREYGLVL
jgi:hypothetical protein